MKKKYIKYIIIFLLITGFMLILWLFFYKLIRKILDFSPFGFIRDFFNFYDFLFKKAFVGLLKIHPLFPLTSILINFFRSQNRFGTTGDPIDDVAIFEGVNWHGSGPIYFGDLEIIGIYED